KAAVARLEELKNDKDPEVALRARMLIESILFGFPKLETLRALSLLGDEPQVLQPSSTGKFLLLLSTKTTRIYETENLSLLTEIAIPCSTVNFDEADKELTLVSKCLIRFETAQWKETFRVPLPDADVAHPRRALILPGNITYYRTSG